MKDTRPSNLREVARYANVNYADAAAVFQAIAMELARGREVRIKDFGAFHAKLMPRKQAKNLNSDDPGARIVTAPYRRVFFRARKALKDFVNG